MGTKLYLCIALTSFMLWNCGNQKNENVDRSKDKLSAQQDDGTMILKLEKAGYYNDDMNPSNNTAEWNVDILKPGRFKVWLSSATSDTTDLSYKTNVRVNFPDCQLVGIPVCNKVVQKSEDVSYPYTADSYMGSVYIPERGEYHIQVVSEKAISKAAEEKLTELDKTKLLAVILTPVSR